MDFENTFQVDAPIDEVYAALLDVGRVAPCVPGAQVYDRTGDDAYEVGIKVKVGPMSMLYKGTVEIVDRDPDAHSASMRARARESRGQGNGRRARCRWRWRPTTARRPAGRSAPT